MSSRPIAARSVALFLGAALVLTASTALAQVKPGKPGPDLTPYEDYRRQLEKGAELARQQRAASGLPTILLTGYWPPTNEMVRHFSDNPVQNPAGWEGANWEGRGYDVYSFFPEFPAGPTFPCDWGVGMGDFEVDYQDTSNDWWRIVDQIKPAAIITFSRGDRDVFTWEVELNQHNHVVWFDDYAAPTQPTPAPPDADHRDDGLRCSTLPADEIVTRVEALGTGLDAWIDEFGDGGRFLSEFIAYHGVWYRSLHAPPSDPDRTLASGHIHIGWTQCEPDITPYKLAVEESLRTLIDLLDAGQEIPPTGVTARTTSATEITVAWNGTSDLYEVWRGPGGCGGPRLPQGQTAANTFVDSTVTLGATYGYVIRSLDWSGACQRDSECVEVTHAICDPLGLNRNVGLLAWKGSGDEVELSWDLDIAAPPEYHLNSVTAKGDLLLPNRGQPGVTAECTVTGTSCTDTDAPTSGEIYYQVLSACADMIGEEGPH